MDEITKHVRDAIADGLERYVKDEAEALLTQVKDKLDRSAAEYVSSITLEFMDRVSLKHMGHELIISIQIDKK